MSDDPECELFHPVETNLARHHRLTLQAIDECAHTRYGRLMLLQPPGSAKSTYGSVVYPSHYAGRYAGSRLILTSYAQELARKMGRRTRSIIRQKRYQRIMNCALSNESHAADQFSLTNGSEYMASGLLSGITGNRADGAVCDDPVSGREDAKSQAMRDKTWDAWQNDLMTRLLPGGWVVLTMTRWDADDIAGRILPDSWNGESGYFDCKDGRRWRVLSLQAKCETTTDPLGRQIGEYLWPEWFDAEHWVPFERDPIAWNSLFQQRPQPLLGAFFTEQMLLLKQPQADPNARAVYAPVPWPPYCDGVYAVIDSAVKSGKKNDGVGVVYFALSFYNQLAYPLTVLDWDYTQMDAALLESWIPNVYKRLEELARICKARQGSRGVWIEDKASGSELLQRLKMKHPPLGPVSAIDNEFVALGKPERMVFVSGDVFADQVKFTEHAWNKTVQYKGRTKNHLLSQILGFTPTVVDQGEDDLSDAWSYGVAIGLKGTKRNRS